jgi:hypothetical protein
MERVLRNATGQLFSWPVAAVTLALGFLPFLVLSVLSDTFWPRSRVAVPLMLSPSILIGDSLLIPLFNGLAFPIIGGFVGRAARLRSHVIIPAAGGLLLSVGLNVFLHVLWSRDEYTGFIDPTRGTLSLGGQWHCAFASLELLFVLVFLTTCFWYRNRIAVGPVLRAWRVIVLYSTMSIFDVVIMFTVVGRSLAQMGIADYIAVSPLILASIVYMFLRSSGRPE